MSRRTGLSKKDSIAVRQQTVAPDNQLSVKSDEKPSIKTDKQPSIVSDNKPSVQTDVKPSVKTDDKLSVKTDDKLSVKTDEKPSVNSDNKSSEQSKTVSIVSTVNPSESPHRKPDEIKAIKDKIISKMQKEAKKGAQGSLDNKRKFFYVKVLFGKRHYYIDLPKLSKMLRTPSVMNLLKQHRLSIVIIEFDENYVLYHSLKNYVNVGCNLLEIITSQICSSQDRHVYHRLKSVTKKENKIKLTTTNGFYKKFEVDAYTVKPDDIELGTSICLDTYMIESSRYPIDDSFKLPIGFNLTFCSEQSTKTTSDVRLTALNTMDSQIENVLDNVVGNGIKLSCSNYDDNTWSKADTTFETNININVDSFYDAKRGLSALFENGRLVFVKGSDIRRFNCREPELVLNGEAYFLACYDYKDGCYKIGTDNNSYFCKFKRFLNGKHVGTNVDGNGSDSVDPDSIFTNFCFDGDKKLSYYNDFAEEVTVVSDCSNYNFEQHLDSIFSNIPKELTENVLAQLEEDSKDGFDTFSTRMKLRGIRPVSQEVAEKYKVGSGVESSPVVFNSVKSELTCGNLKLSYMDGYDGLYIDASKYNLTDYTAQAKSQVLNSPCKVLNYELDDSKFKVVKISDYLKFISDFHPEEVKSIENKLADRKIKRSVFGLMDREDKFKLLTYCYSQFSEIITSQFLINLSYMDEIYCNEFVETNPTYFIEMVAKENKIDLNEIIESIEQNKINEIEVNLKKLNTHLYKTFSEIPKSCPKITINDTRKKEIITNGLKETESTVDESIFNAFVEKYKIDCSIHYENFVSAIEKTLESYYGLTFKSSLNDYQHAFETHPKTDKEEEEEEDVVDVQKLYNAIQDFANFNSLYESENGHHKTMIKVFQRQF